MPTDRDDVVELFQRYGKVFTGTRARIYAILSTEKKPLSAKEVWESLGSERPDLATVYRSLTAMTQMGVVRKVPHGSNTALYELCSVDCHSHQVVCQGCGRKENLPCTVMNELAKQIQAASGFSMDHQSLEIPGHCPNCRHKL